MRAAIYTRVSSDEQAKEGFSLEFQEMDCIAYAEKNGFTVVGVYSDPGFSGALESRPALDRLLRDADALRFDILLTWRFDRLYRIVEYQKKARRELAEQGILWKSTTENVDIYTSSGNLQHSILGSFAEWERDTIKERTTAGRKQKALKGRQTNPIGCPLGYRIIRKADALHDPRYKDQDGLYEIVEEEAAVVRRIFSLYLGGCSLWEVCKILTDEGCKTQRGGQWRPGILSNMLRNRAYIGEAFHHRVEHRKVRNSRTGQYHNTISIRDREEWVSLEVPALVSLEVFEKAQTLLGQNQKRRSGRPERLYALSGMIQCSECGMRYIGQYSQSCRTRYYRAHQKRSVEQAHQCNWQRLIRADNAEGGILRLLAEIARNPEVVRQALLNYEREQEKRQGSGEERRRLTDELAKVERQLKSILEREIDEPEMANLYGDLKASKKEQRQALMARLSALPADLERSETPSFTTLEAVCDELSRRLIGITDLKVIREIFLSLIEGVEVQPDGSLLVKIYGDKLSLPMGRMGQHRSPLRPSGRHHSDRLPSLHPLLLELETPVHVPVPPA